MFPCRGNVMFHLNSLPVILGLQELELLLDPVAGLSDSELKRLSRLVRDLNPSQTAREGKRGRTEPPKFSVTTQTQTQARLHMTIGLCDTRGLLPSLSPLLHVKPRTLTGTHIQLQQLDNERNCPCERAVARKLDLK